ncbi:MAG TPA: glutathione S-transferase family protein [Candidatus Competibacteraceae bacterium]|nr:glutathione S-transferase family protein [Candidatus Competibacteraceae bacterium]
MAALTLVLGNKTYSSWSLRPWLLLKHLAVDFQEIMVPLHAPDAAAHIARYSPSGRVPVLLDGDQVIWESLAIGETLAERYPNVWPADAACRALARAAASEMHAGFAALREELPFNCRARRSGVFPSAAAQADIARIVALWVTCRQTVQAGEGPWLFGPFTLADAMFAPVALRFYTYGIALPEAAQAYVDTVRQDRFIQAWIQAARQETTVIPGEERGEPVNE